MITAVHVLYEHYDESMGFAEVNGEIIPSDFATGWINNVLDKKFSIKRRLRVWESAEACAIWRSEYNDDLVSIEQLWDIIPEDYRTVAGGTELSDVIYIINGTDTLTDDEVIPGTYPYDVLECKNAVINLIKEQGEKEAYSRLINLMKSPAAKRKKEKEAAMKPLAEMSLYMPARVFLYLISEQLDKKFWPEWLKLKDEVYKDEVLKEYASEELTKHRNEIINAPIEKVGTSEFLRQDGAFVFWDTPEELKDEPRYYLSDKDRLYWWDGWNDVKIDEDTKGWLIDISNQYEEILIEETIVFNTRKAFAGESGVYDSEQFIKEIVELLEAIDNRYGRVMAFNEMFYEFISNGQKKEYHAAIRLLGRLYEKNAEAGKIIKKVGNWELSSKQAKCNKGRMCMKRYLSLLANKKLRKKYLGF